MEDKRCKVNMDLYIKSFLSRKLLEDNVSLI